MDALECILTRRSIRKFLPEPVEEDKLITILKAGMYAPSAGNQQPWFLWSLMTKKFFIPLPIFIPMPKCAMKHRLAFWCAAIPFMRSTPATGRWIVQLPLRICCWPFTPWGSEEYGLAFTPEKKGCRKSYPLFPFPNHICHFL